MKALIYRYGSICEPDIIEGLKRLGFTVDEINNEITNKGMTAAEGVGILSPKLMSDNYIFVFTINFFPWISEVCKITGTVYISLVVDSPVWELFTKSIENKINRVFIFDKAQYEEVAAYNRECVFHIPLATNVDRNDRVIAKASVADKEKFKADISFIGSTYQEKCPLNRGVFDEYEQGYLDGLIETQLNIYGFNFIENALTDEMTKRLLAAIPGHYELPQDSHANDRMLLAQQYISVKVAEQERIRTLKRLSEKFNVNIYTGSDTSQMPKINNRGFAKSLTEMPLIFNQSRINLNITAKSIRSGLSLRVFDVLGAGGFLITNYQAEIPEIFTINKDLVCYESMENLQELCRYYLKHDDERMQIAANGYETVKKYHNIDGRLLEIFSLAFPKGEGSQI